MNVLVGYTGFVGSNLYVKGDFDHVFNSKNIEESYGLNPDLLIYAGLRAEKYLANNAPQKDMELIEQAEDNIKKINPKKLVFISTIDVFKNPRNVNESTDIDTNDLHAYGYNRYIMECWVRQNYPDALIIRLPGLFGMNIKKNFIYDYMKLIPFMLTQDKFGELSKRDADLDRYYKLQENGFYKCKILSNQEETTLKQKFKALGFTALNFTDSRSKFQFYPLARLWDDIQLMLKEQVMLWHPATEPISTSEVYEYLEGEKFENILSKEPANYNYRTNKDELFGHTDGYIMSKIQVLSEIKNFITER